MVDRVNEIVEFLAGGVRLAELRELHAAAGRTAVVRIEDREAARGADLPGIGIA